MIQLVTICKSYPGVNALVDVDLTLEPGSIHALVGENGAGKSTLINILSGFLSPDSGEIILDGVSRRFRNAREARRAGIVTVHQEVNLFAKLTVAENIALERGRSVWGPGFINWKKEIAIVQASLDNIGAPFPPTQKAGLLSPGQRQLVEIAAALHDPAHLLILDEPTSSLAEAEVQILFKHLRAFQDRGTAILYVSHRLEEIFDLADRVTVLRDGRLIWSGPLVETNSASLIRLMVGREITHAGLEPPQNLGPVRFRSHAVSDAAGRCHDISLEVRGGEILGIYGLVGAGRTEWAQTVFGLRTLRQGHVEIDGVVESRPSVRALIRRGLAYVPEDRLGQGLFRGLAVRLNLVIASLGRLARLGWITQSMERKTAEESVRRLAVKLRSLDQPAGSLSGGNQQKVVLARWLARDPAVLVIDEPTRGIDVGARAEIYRLLERLAQQGHAVILISSDLAEVMAQTQRVAVFRSGRLTGMFDSHQASADQVAAAALADERPARSQTMKAVSDSDSCRSIYRASSATAFAGLNFLRASGLALVILLVIGLLQASTGDYLQSGSLYELATNTALLSFCAVGAALVVIAGGIDISLGAIMALSAALAGRLWQEEHSIGLVVLVAAGVGLLGGTTNGLIALICRIHPIVVTLGTLSLYRGLTLASIKEDIQVTGHSRQWLIDFHLGLPMVVWLGLLLIGAIWVLLGRTVWGRQFYAVGDNPPAAQKVGVPVRGAFIRAFAIQGFLAGLAGLLYLARSGNVQSTSFEDKTLEAIAAAVLGGVAVTGGKGHVLGVALGCVFLALLAPACILLHISTNWQRTLVGSVLVIAVVIDVLGNRRRA